MIKGGERFACACVKETVHPCTRSLLSGLWSCISPRSICLGKRLAAVV